MSTNSLACLAFSLRLSWCHNSLRMASSPVMFDPEVLQELLDMVYYPPIAAAFDARMNGILASMMEMTEGEGKAKPIMQQTIRDHLVPMIRDVVLQFWAPSSSE